VVLGGLVRGDRHQASFVRRIIAGMEKFGEQYVADISAEGQHLRLRSEATKDGARAVVYDLETGQEILNDLVGDLKEGRERCEECAKGLLTEPIEIAWAHHQAAA
jgi:hypothetical protein